MRLIFASVYTAIVKLLGVSLGPVENYATNTS